MNLQRHNTSRCRACNSPRGYTLIEVMVYISMLFLILGMGYAAMYRSMDTSRGLSRNANDIARAMKAGERWREDVRNAAASIRAETISPNETVFHIPQGHGEVDYRFTSNSVARRAAKGEWVPVLDSVKASDFIVDPRKTVTAWRWEVELLPYRKAIVRTRPLFTFIAVPERLLAK
jgi:type II secretory pathway pseudopilin PulG